MSKKVRHVLGISGGKDSAALAIYMHKNYPEIDIEYYTCDTGKELEETYQLIDNLEGYLGKKIIPLKAFEGSTEAPFDHKLKLLSGFLPSQQNRWCTKYLKLDPFEKFVSNDLVISYVGIRGDEDREGYISRKQNIQSIFPFRKNIWSEDVIMKILRNDNISSLLESYHFLFPQTDKSVYEIIEQKISLKFPVQHKLQLLLERGIKQFNKVAFELLKLTNYPLAFENNFSLLENEENLVRDDIFKLLRESGVGVPDYYEKKSFYVNGKIGEYSRSRSGCYFCFFQQKIEWIWLYEQHPEKFQLALDYEKDGFTWNEDETLLDIVKPERMQIIKENFILKSNSTENKSPYLIDILDEAETEGCAACFI